MCVTGWKEDKGKATLKAARANYRKYGWWIRDGTPIEILGASR
jgi:hypothetical protein